MAINCLSSSGEDKTEKTDQNSLASNLDCQMGELSGFRLDDLIGGKVDENFGQRLNSCSMHKDSSIDVTTMMKGII